MKHKITDTNDLGQVRKREIGVQATVQLHVSRSSVVTELTGRVLKVLLQGLFLLSFNNYYPCFHEDKFEIRRSSEHCILLL